MNAGRRRLTLYLTGVIMAGAAATLLAFLLQPPELDRHRAVLAVLVVSLTALAYPGAVRLSPNRSIIPDTAVEISAILIFPPGAAALLCALGVAAGNAGYLRRPWMNVLFNASQVALSVVLAAALYRLLAPVSLVARDRDLWSVLALLPAAAVLFLVGALAVDGAIALQRRRSPFTNWAALHGPAVLPFAFLALVGAAVAIAVDRRPWLIVAAVVPVLVIRAVVQAAQRFDAGLLRLAEDLADAADEQRGGAPGRSRRAAALAHDLARARGLDAVAAAQASQAARLATIGARLRTVSGPRAEAAEHAAGESWQEAEAAAAWVETVLHVPAIAEIIRLQHESFDGRGRPFGLVGVEIPLASRIVALCYAWLTLTGERPYRPSLSPQQALLILHAGAGTQWDPQLVQVLSTILPREGDVAEAAQPAPPASLADRPSAR